MERNILLFGVIFLLACNSTETMFIHDPNDMVLGKNTDEGYYFVIRSTHTLKKRDVFALNTVQPTGVQTKEETIIILPNAGMNYPYTTYLTNPISRYGVSRGTTVIVNNPDSNYNSGYGGKPYLPNKYG